MAICPGMGRNSRIDRGALRKGLGLGFDGEGKRVSDPLRTGVRLPSSPPILKEGRKWNKDGL